MKRQLILLFFVLVCGFSYGQSNATIVNKNSISINDLQKIMYFEGIGIEKFKIKSDCLIGKNFQIIIKEFKDGIDVKNDTVFNSKEDEYFRIKTDSLTFSVLTKMLDSNYFKVQIQFNRFSIDRKYSVLNTEREKFVLKSLYDTRKESPISLNRINYLLVYMMPYIKSDMSETYCEVVQSGTDPERLYDKYKIPHYFLIAIRFE